MYWQEKPLTYEIVLPPILKPFNKFTKKQAETYFNWYMNIRYERIAYLQEQSGVLLDYSEESLTEVWKWFGSKAEIEEPPEARMEEIKEGAKGLPDSLAEMLIQKQSKQLSLQTEYIIRDIAMYFGELFVRKYPRLKWTFITTADMGVERNRPVIDGFCVNGKIMAFCPEWAVRVKACNLLDNTSRPADLHKLYGQWLRILPD